MAETLIIISVVVIAAFFIAYRCGQRAYNKLLKEYQYAIMQLQVEHIPEEYRVTRDANDSKTTLSWEYRDLNNGCVISDVESGLEECAEFVGSADNRVYQLLGAWLYNEVRAFADRTMSSHISIKISLQIN